MVGIMNSIIDLAFFFILSLSTMLIVLLLVNKKKLQDRYNKELKDRLKLLSSQQDRLLEDTARSGGVFLQKLSYQALDDGEKHKGILSRITELKRIAGLVDMSNVTFIGFCFAGGLVISSIIVHFEFLNALTGIPIGFAVGMYLAFNLLAMIAARRKMAFLQLFPDAIDMMIRGVKAGLTINRIMKLVSMESKEPIATEYKIMHQKLELGVKAEKVFTDAADRIGIEEFRFLVVALILQMENGGVLGEILQNLSGMVRKRLELDLKLKAMSAEARMSAIVLSALPFAFAGIMAVLSPSHMEEFTKPGIGQTLLKIMIVLFSFGVFFMIKATKIKV